MSELQIDAKAAQQWLDEKNQLQQDVMTVLADLDKAVDDPTGQDNDSIMKAVATVSDRMTDGWTKLGNAFTEVSNQLQKVLNDIYTRGTESQKLVENLGKGFKLS